MRLVSGQLPNKSRHLNELAHEPAIWSVMGYWSVAILFWQRSIDHIVNVQCKRCGLAKTRLRHPSVPFDGLLYPTRTILRRVPTLGQSRDNQTKRGWPYSMNMGLARVGARYKLNLFITDTAVIRWIPNPDQVNPVWLMSYARWFQKLSRCISNNDLQKVYRGT